MTHTYTTRVQSRVPFSDRHWTRTPPSASIKQSPLHPSVLTPAICRTFVVSKTETSAHGNLKSYVNVHDKMIPSEQEITWRILSLDLQISSNKKCDLCEQTRSGWRALTFTLRHTVTCHTVHNLNNNYRHFLLIYQQNKITVTAFFLELQQNVFSYAKEMPKFIIIWIPKIDAAHSCTISHLNRLKRWVPSSRVIPHSSWSYATGLNLTFITKRCALGRYMKQSGYRTHQNKTAFYLYLVLHAWNPKRV
jgi:hypothetical protein